MGLFSFIGRAVKAVAHVVGGVVRTVAAVSKFIPGVGTVVQSAENFAMPVLRAVHLVKAAKLGIERNPVLFPTLAATAPTATNILALHKHAKHAHKVHGGKHAHIRLIQGKSKKRRPSSKRRPSKARATGRKLKFGSPAWQKKYRKRRAA